MNMTDVFVGSSAAGGDLEVNATIVEVPTATRYLADATPSRSLIAAVATAIAEVVPGTTAYLARDKRVRIVSGGGPLTLVVPVTLQRALGLDAAPTPATTIVAARQSVLLWCPGAVGTPEHGPVGSTGVEVDDAIVTRSPDAMRITVTRHHTHTRARWTWPAVHSSRAWTPPAGEPGQLVVWRAEVVRRGHRFKLASGRAEALDGVVDPTAMDLAAPLGPYKADPTQGQEWWRRLVATLDEHVAVDLPALLTGEV